jgi:hypothetical protein
MRTMNRALAIDIVNDIRALSLIEQKAERLEAVVANAVAAEREACAAVADRQTAMYRETLAAMGDSMMKELAAIRAETASLVATAIRARH